MAAPTLSTPPRAGRAMLLGGLLAGTLDLIFAFIYYGPKLGVVQSIAGGLIGRSAYEGGWQTALLGIILHYLISLIWAGIYWMASRRLSVPARHPVPAGLLYGLVIFYGMNLIVLPLSALHTKAWPPPFAFWPIAIHLLIGLCIAGTTRFFSRETRGA